ncbi:hypothetical protein KCU85_g7493, partial [Aureobasidium melanogenum]
MTVLLPSSSPIELCNRSSSVLATRDRIAPGVLPVSLREHPIWGLLVTHEGSAYEHDCKVADAYRHDSGFIWIGIDINVEDRAQSSLPLALLDRKKDELLEAYSPVEFCVVNADEALSSFKYEKFSGTNLPMAIVVTVWSSNLVEPAATSGKSLEYKFRRKKRCADLRAENAV